MESQNDNPISKESKDALSLYFSLLEQISFGAMILDQENRILYANPALRSILSDRKIQDLNLIDLCVCHEEIPTLLEWLHHSPRSPLTLTLLSDHGEKIETRVYGVTFKEQILLFFFPMTILESIDHELSTFQSAIESADDGIVFFDREGLIFFVNPSFEQQINLSAAQLLGNNIDMVWERCIESHIRDTIWEHLHRMAQWSGEITYHYHEQHWAVWNIRIKPISKRGTQTEFIGFISIFQDITHQKKLEQELSMYSEILERKVMERTEALSKLHEITTLFHSTDTLEKRLHLVLIAATAGETFRFNRAFLSLVNEKENTLQGTIAIGPSDAQEAGKIWSSLENRPREQGLTQVMEYYLHKNNQREYQVNHIVKKMNFPMDQDDSLMVQSLKQKRSFIVRHGKAEIEFNNDLLSMLGSNNFAVIPLLIREKPIGVLMVDNVITQSPIFEQDVKMLEILASQAALAIAHANTLDELAQRVDETHQAYSELRESQQKLIESEKFAALGQMAATVAHEIRTPLVSMGGFANIMLKREQPDPNNQRYLQIIRDESLRLEEVLKTLLYYARSSEPVIDSQNVKLFIENVVEFLEVEAEELDIHFQISLSNSFPMVPFDRNQMRQVMINILKNSMQSAKKGDTIIIKGVCEGPYCVLSICDTGKGIDPAHIPQVFEPFFSTKHYGTGLGLHVSKRIVESHGGHIEIDSHVGEGTEVKIYLPLDGGQSNEKNSDRR